MPALRSRRRHYLRLPGLFAVLTHVKKNSPELLLPVLGSHGEICAGRHGDEGNSVLGTGGGECEAGGLGSPDECF